MPIFDRHIEGLAILFVQETLQTSTTRAGHLTPWAWGQLLDEQRLLDC